METYTYIHTYTIYVYREKDKHLYGKKDKYILINSYIYIYIYIDTHSFKHTQVHTSHNTYIRDKDRGRCLYKVVHLCMRWLGRYLNICVIDQIYDKLVIFCKQTKKKKSLAEFSSLFGNCQQAIGYEPKSKELLKTHTR